MLHKATPIETTEDSTAKPLKKSDKGAISRSMLIVMSLTMIGKLTGFMRETVQASRFGVSGVTDAIKTATEAPTFFLSIIITALAAAFIPIYNEKLAQGKEKADRFMNNITTLGMAVIILGLFLTALFIRPLVTRLMLPFAAAETQEMAIEMTRVLMPVGVFVFLSRMATAYLQANFSFTVPALSQIFLNVIIIGAIILSKGANVLYVAIGTLIGWFAQFLAQTPRLYSLGYRYRPLIDWKEPLLRDVTLLMLPLLASGLFDQLYLIIRAMASDMAGHITVLDLSTRLSTLVSAVLLTTIATVLYPSLVRHVAEPDRFRDNLSFGININVLIALPAAAAMLFLSLPITRLVYQRGAFSGEDTLLTAQTLAMTAIGIPGIGLRELFTRSFYAHKDIKAPTIIGILSVLLNAGLSFLLYRAYGAPGIAIATSVSAIASAVVLFILLEARHHAIEGRRVLRCLWKTTVATAVMTAALLFLAQVLHISTLVGTSFLLTMVLLIGVGVALYIAVLWALRMEELSMALKFIKRKLARKA